MVTGCSAIEWKTCGRLGSSTSARSLLFTRPASRLGQSSTQPGHTRADAGRERRGCVGQHRARYPILRTGLNRACRLDTGRTRARTLKSLAEAYLTRLSGDRDDNVDTALAYTTAALAERSRDELPIEWALTMNLMGDVCVRRRGDRAENVEQALKVYRQALTVLTDVTAPADHRMIQTNLGHLCFAEQRWMEAAADLPGRAGLWHGGCYLQAATPLARQSELARNHDLHGTPGLCPNKERDSLAEAVVACEEGTSARRGGSF